MKIIQSGFKANNDYTIHFESSLLWEAALGIAAITNTSLSGTLEHIDKMWDNPENGFSDQLQRSLKIVHERNTWKALLQLLHHSNAHSLADWSEEIKQLSATTLREQCLPYIGSSFEETRKEAASGDKHSIAKLQEITADNPFFPDYIAFIAQTDSQFLKEHLLSVMTDWFQEVIKPREEGLQDMLARDTVDKKRKLETMEKLDFMRWITHSPSFKPDESIHTILFIPHYYYRPWTITADLPGTKVFYYPVHANSIDPENRYNPDTMLVRKYKALGDAMRLHLLKRLNEGEQTLQQLAEQMPAAKSTLHHHLKMLKSAGLIDSNKQVYYVNKQSIAPLDSELYHFLKE
ncbi:helix-turn-helix transcriptional regulator [Terribacillus sp. DMT04]|uniref:ArsR/SmtB family transcription factor n=1 Tax=Terribacillus sp. DMT04 TaxID=2850441 RepID=UPI001C2C0840|nr:metalloregulator ArsR/SmtB family transcription factor [Terribacillus sp. DMT04]QXE02161.1 helix-turn-helix domain-containing protein [Terribacillus sp. DMT04]